MQIRNAIYVGASAQVDAPPTTAGADREHSLAAQAARAVQRTPDQTVAALYHVTADPSVAAPELDPAARILTAAGVPRRDDAYSVTIANGVLGVFDALTRAATMLDTAWYPSSSVIYLTAGDAGPTEQHDGAPDRGPAGVCLSLNQSSGRLRLATLWTWTDERLQRMIDKGADEAMIKYRTDRLVRHVADDALAQTHDAAGERRWIGDATSIVTPYATTSAAHRELLTAIDVDLPPLPAGASVASAASEPAGPLSLMRQLGQLVDARETEASGPDQVILAISPCENATVSAAVFELS